MMCPTLSVIVAPMFVGVDFSTFSPAECWKKGKNQQISSNIIIYHSDTISYYISYITNHYTSNIKYHSGLPSGKQPHNYGKIHHAIHGKIRYFDWAIFKFANCYQRVCVKGNYQFIIPSEWITQTLSLPGRVTTKYHQISSYTIQILYHQPL